MVTETSWEIGPLLKAVKFLKVFCGSLSAFEKEDPKIAKDPRAWERGAILYPLLATLCQRFNAMNPEDKKAIKEGLEIIGDALSDYL